MEPSGGHRGCTGFHDMARLHGPSACVCVVRPLPVAGHYKQQDADEISRLKIRSLLTDSEAQKVTYFTLVHGFEKVRRGLCFTFAKRAAQYTNYVRNGVRNAE